MSLCRRSLLLTIGLCLLASGCQTTGQENTAAGTIFGTGAGALAGAIIGNQSGHSGAGALIGAAAGGLAGGLLGNAADAREERDDAVRHAAYVERQREAEAQAMTEMDLVRLTESGASPEVIISAVKSNGGRFNLNPAGLIRLKQLGVSDQVILEIQRTGRISGPNGLTVVTGSLYVPSAVTPIKRTYVVEEPDVIYIGGPRFHHHHCHSGPSLSYGYCWD